MRKVLLMLAVLSGLAIIGCSLFAGKVNVLVKGVSDQGGAGSTLVATPLATVAGASNEVIFSPETFNVKIIKVEVLKDILDTTWVTVFDSGSTLGDIVQQVSLVSASGALEVEGGSYNGVKLTYDTMWNVTALVSSNDLPTVGIAPGSNYTYYDTNGITSASAEIYFATATLKTSLEQLGVNTQYINDLSAPLEFNGSLDSITLNLVFETRNMIKVWTNKTGGSVDNIEYTEPNLAVTVN